MKKIISAILSAIILVSGFMIMPLSVSAASLYTYYFDEDSGGVYIEAYNGTKTKLTIPSKIDGKTVTGITSLKNSKDKANTKLTSVTIPSGVNFIQGECFNDMSALREIKVAKDNKTFKAENGVLYFDALYENKRVVRVPEALSGKITLSSALTYNDSAFLNCTKVTEYGYSGDDEAIHVMDGVIYGNYNGNEYSKAGKLLGTYDYNSKNIILETWKVIAFPGAKSGAYTFPKSYDRHGDGHIHYISIDVLNRAFITNTRNITSFVIKRDFPIDSVNLVKTVDGVIFSKYNSLVAYPGAKKTATYTISSDTFMVERYAFYKCANLITLNFPKSIKGDLPEFADCPKLKTIKFPETISDNFGTDNDVAPGWYVNLPLLTSITLPKGSSFYTLNSSIINCPLLKTIKIPKSTITDDYQKELLKGLQNDLPKINISTY